jgi:hypothetical protein
MQSAYLFPNKEIPALPEEYLRKCIKAGTDEVRILRGKGHR